MEFTFQCQDASQKCENLYGSYKCVCGEGLYWIDNKCQGLSISLVVGNDPSERTHLLAISTETDKTPLQLPAE